MREQEARDLAAFIQEHYQGRITAELDESSAYDGHHGYRVALLLVPGQRRATINYCTQWNSMLQAWSLFLEGDDRMKITVWTREPSSFIRQARRALRQRGGSPASADELLNRHIEGQAVSWERLTLAQFNAIEDTAARLGLEYDGRQAL